MRNFSRNRIAYPNPKTFRFEQGYTMWVDYSATEFSGWFNRFDYLPFGVVDENFYPNPRQGLNVWVYPTRVTLYITQPGASGTEYSYRFFLIRVNASHDTSALPEFLQPQHVLTPSNALSYTAISSMTATLCPSEKRQLPFSLIWSKYFRFDSSPPHTNQRRVHFTIPGHLQQYESGDNDIVRKSSYHLLMTSTAPITDMTYVWSLFYTCRFKDIL